MDVLYLDIPPEVFHTLVVILVTWPFGTIDRDFTGLCQWVSGFLRQVLDAVYVRLAYLFALSSVVDVEACDGGDDREEDQPVS